MLAILLPRVSIKTARMFMPRRRMMMAHMQKRRTRTRRVPLKDQNLVYSPNLRQLRDFQEPSRPSSMFVTPSMLDEGELVAYTRWSGLSK